MNNIISTIAHFFRRYPTSIVGFSVVIFFIITDFTYHIDIFRAIINYLNEKQFLHTEKIIFSVVLIIITLLIDQFRNVRRTRRKRRLEQERLNTARATMATMNDLVNNFLNNILLVQMEIEKKEPLSDETITMFNNMTSKLSLDMKRINDIDVVAERNLSETFRVLDFKN